jgi:hypothetical protein
MAPYYVTSMNQLTQFNDDSLFDRLVDGELSADERRALLQSLDAAPGGWRRCAIAFLEAQTWGDGLRRVVREPAPIMTDDVQPASVPHSAFQPTGLHRRPLAWFAIAAGLLVTVTLVITQRGGAPNITDTAQSNSTAPAPDTVPPVTSPQAANDEDMLTFWVRDETGQQRPMRVPLVDADPMDRELGLTFQSGMPDGLRSRLRGRGYDVQSRRRYAPLEMENGRRMIVPVEDTKIVPVSQNVY